jgi:hypothetical protein
MMWNPPKLLQEPDRSLTLVVSPRRKDVIAKRGYLAGNIVLFSGLAASSPYFGKWDLYARLGVTLLGGLAGIVHGYAAVLNSTAPMRFTFQSRGGVLVASTRGRVLRRQIFRMRGSSCNAKDPAVLAPSAGAGHLRGSLPAWTKTTSRRSKHMACASSRLRRQQSRRSSRKRNSVNGGCGRPGGAFPGGPSLSAGS